MIEHIKKNYNNPYKRYIEVIAKFTSDGNIKPLAIVYKNKEWSVDRIHSIKAKASIIAGGIGLCYCCEIGGHNHQLYLEDNRWFLEVKPPMSKA